MRVFIIGAGFTGTQLAKSLVERKHMVTLIDSDAERVRHASDQLDCTVIEAEGNNLEVLEEAGISSADALVTLTEDDETNMITCSLVDAVYPKILKLARVRNLAYYRAAESARRLSRESANGYMPLYGIDFMINPDIEAAGAISSAIEHGAVGNVIRLDSEHCITTLQISEDSQLAGQPVRELHKIEGWHYLVAFVESKGVMSLPDGNTVLNHGDRIGIVSTQSEIQQLTDFTGTSGAELRRIVIFGADRVGSLLVQQLETQRSISLLQRIFKRDSRRQQLIVVDKDAERCQEIVRKYPGIRALCGDVTDENLLAEENIADCDLLVAASGNHELNLVTAAYLKSRGVRRTIALTANSSYGDIANKLGIDVAVPLRGTVVDSILGYLNGANVHAVHSVCNRQFEIITGTIQDKSSVASKCLADIPRDAEFLTLLVRKPGEAQYIIPCGATTLEPNSEIVVILNSGDDRGIKRFFGKG